MRGHPALFSDFLVLGSKEDYAAYCNKVEKTAVWGGQHEIIALCHALKRNVEVYRAIPVDETRVDGLAAGEARRPSGPPKMVVEKNVFPDPHTEPIGGYPGTPLRVSYHIFEEGGEHYNSVISFDGGRRRSRGAAGGHTSLPYGRRSSGSRRPLGSANDGAATGGDGAGGDEGGEASGDDLNGEGEKGDDENDVDPDDAVSVNDESGDDGASEGACVPGSGSGPISEVDDQEGQDDGEGDGGEEEDEDEDEQDDYEEDDEGSDESDEEIGDSSDNGGAGGGAEDGNAGGEGSGDDSEDGDASDENNDHGADYCGASGPVKDDEGRLMQDRNGNDASVVPYQGVDEGPMTHDSAENQALPIRDDVASGASEANHAGAMATCTKPAASLSSLMTIAAEGCSLPSAGFVPVSAPDIAMTPESAMANDALVPAPTASQTLPAGSTGDAAMADVENSEICHRQPSPMI